MTRKKYHVTKTESGWQGKLEKAERATITGTTKQEVLQKTIEIAKNHNNSQVFIHATNGRIQEERTYPRSIDPRKTKG
jgi:hypothetical protein